MARPPANGTSEDSADVGFRRIRALVDRLLAAILLIFVVIAVAGLGLRYWEAARDSRRNAENLAELLSEYLVIRLGAVDGVLFRIVGGSRRIGGPAAADREWAMLLRTATSGVPGVSAIIITDAAGTVAHATIPQIVGLSWADKPIFRTLVNGRVNLLAVDPPVAVIAGDEVLIPFGRALTNPRGEFIGTVIATVVPNHLRDFFSAVDLGQAGITWVMLPSGELIFREGSDTDLANTPTIERERLANGATLPGDGFVRGPLVAGGRAYLTAFRRSDIAGVILGVSLAESDVLSTWRYEVLGAVLFLVLVGTLLTAARRRIANALIDLFQDAQTGDPPPPAPR